MFVGMLGNFNSGKTWLLSKLSRGNKKFAQGLNNSTQGINIVGQQIYDRESDTSKYDEKWVYFMDTAGSGEPIQINRCFE